MTVLKRYVLRLFMSIKYITANVVDRNNGRIVTTASTVEHTIKNSLECGRTCNAKAAAIVGEVLAMRLKVKGFRMGKEEEYMLMSRKKSKRKGLRVELRYGLLLTLLETMVLHSFLTMMMMMMSIVIVLLRVIGEFTIFVFYVLSSLVIDSLCVTWKLE